MLDAAMSLRVRSVTLLSMPTGECLDPQGIQDLNSSKVVLPNSVLTL